MLRAQRTLGAWFPRGLRYGRWVASAACCNPVSSTNFPFLLTTPTPPLPHLHSVMSANSSLAGDGLGKSLFQTSFLRCCFNSEPEPPRMSQKTGHGSYTDLAASLQKYSMTTYYVPSISSVAFSSNCHLPLNPKRSQRLHPTTVAS